METAKRNYTFIIIIMIALFNSSCSTRSVHDEYFGATEQRLLTKSIDALVKMLPEKDFNPLKEKSVYLSCHFIEDNTTLDYAKKRIELELVEKYMAIITTEPNSADKIVYVFFNALGTDQDSFGLKTPEFIVPGVNGSLVIDLISLDMYHGISELYYYVLDRSSSEIIRGEQIKSIIRTDKLSLPIISIPINTLD